MALMRRSSYRSFAGGEYAHEIPYNEVLTDWQHGGGSCSRRLRQWFRPHSDVCSSADGCGCASANVGTGANSETGSETGAKAEVGRHIELCPVRHGLV